MKRLEDLKAEILNDDIKNFYVFYGEDYGIRKHYVDKIKTYFDDVSYLEDCKNLENGVDSKFKTDKRCLYIVYGDEDILNYSESKLKSIINSIKVSTVILLYESMPDKCVLVEHFENYITYFPVVQKSIAKEFVDDLLKLDDSAKDLFVASCACNYNCILNEADKISNYSEGKNVSNQIAYETILLKGQLDTPVDEFRGDLFMNDLLKENVDMFSTWYIIITYNCDKVMYYLNSMFNDFIIAGLIKKFGTYKGGSMAYNYKLSWNRVKAIREFALIKPDSYYFDNANKLARLDMLVKTGQMSRDEIADYIFTNII